MPSGAIIRVEDVEKELRKKYTQLQLMKQQLSAFVEQKNMLDEKMAEISQTIGALEHLESVGTGDEIWSPLGSGAFVRSDIKDTETVLVSVGAGIVIRKGKDASVEILKSRLDELSTIDKELFREMAGLAEQVGKLEPEVEKLAEKAARQR